MKPESVPEVIRFGTMRKLLGHETARSEIEEIEPVRFIARTGEDLGKR